MIFYLLIVFLFTFNIIHSEGQDKRDEKDDKVKLKLIADKICIDKPDKKSADKIAICENLVKTTVSMNI